MIKIDGQGLCYFAFCMIKGKNLIHQAAQKKLYCAFIFFFAMIAYNVYGHLGYELYPKGFAKHRIGKWINTSVSHNQHHQFFKGNYGLYFTIWDRLMGTLRKDYEQRFDEIASRKHSGTSSPA